MLKIIQLFMYISKYIGMYTHTDCTVLYYIALYIIISYYNIVSYSTLYYIMSPYTMLRCVTVLNHRTTTVFYDFSSYFFALI